MVRFVPELVSLPLYIHPSGACVCAMCIFVRFLIHVEARPAIPFTSSSVSRAQVYGVYFIFFLTPWLRCLDVTGRQSTSAPPAPSLSSVDELFFLVFSCLPDSFDSIYVGLEEQDTIGAFCKSFCCNSRTTGGVILLIPGGEGGRYNHDLACRGHEAIDRASLRSLGGAHRGFARSCWL